MKNPDHISESLETIFWFKILLKFFAADPEFGMEIIRIRDDPQHWFKLSSQGEVADDQLLYFDCMHTKRKHFKYQIIHGRI